MIAVAATNSNDEKASFSNYGDWIDIAAPGVDILSLRASGTSMGTTYDSYTTIASGTSMSCPHTAGVTALIISQYPGAVTEDVTARLFGTTDSISQENPGYESLLGYGRVNAYNAVALEARPHIIFQDCVVLDAAMGNGNGFLEPAETAQLRITLKNIWVDANNVTAQLGTDDPNITILDDFSYYADIARDQQRDNSHDLFEVSLSEECLPGNKGYCYLTITADGNYTNVVYFTTTGILKVPAHFPTIQQAVDICGDGDTIIVADGTYTGHGNRDVDFKGKAITIKSENGPQYCIIDCQGSPGDPHRGFYLHSGEGGDSVIDGFTIINGYAPSDGDTWKFSDGGAICCDGYAHYPWIKRTSPTIRNCIINNNRAADCGAGIYCCYGSAKIVNCEVSSNYGEGIFFRGLGFPVMIGCKVINNDGYGVTAWRLAGCSVTITNSLVAYNNGRSGIYAESAGLWISNSTIANNKGCGICTHGREVTMANSIVWGNTRGAFSNLLPQTVYEVTYSDIQGGKSGQGNINIDPEFNIFSDDFHLMAGSACIDAGTNDPFNGLDADDMDGNPRLQDGDGDGNAVVDMGACEFEQWDPSKPYIHVTPRRLIYNCGEESPTQEEQTVHISNIGAGTLNWRIVEDCNWVEVIPTSGQSVGEVDEAIVCVDTTGQLPGHYSCTLEISDEQVPVRSQLVMINLSIGPRRVPQQYPTIQAAIDAWLPGNTIVVADGVYTGSGNGNISFHGKAITLRSENGPQNCIIDCKNSGRGFYFIDNEANDSIVKGFTITNGYAYSEQLCDCWGGDSGDLGFGGGIYCENSSPTIANCRVINCKARGYFGGGIFCKYSNATIVQCTIKGNSSGREGGGILCFQDGSVTIDSCTIINNTARGLEKTSAK